MKKLLPLILISILTLFIWRPVLDQALLGEGPIYFNHPYLEMLDNDVFQTLFARHDTQALIFFKLTRNLFKDNFKFYMWFLLAGSSFVNISLYFLVKKLTRSTLPGIFTVAIFVANYVGSYEILGLGYYQWFIQRVPNFGLAIISLILFTTFLEKRKNLYYFLGFLTYTISIFLARYTIHILPLLIFYLFFAISSLKKAVKNKFFLFLKTSLPLIGISYLLFQAQSLVSGSSEIDSLNSSLKFLPSTLNQLTFLTFPIFKPASIWLPSTLIYLLALFFVYKKAQSLRPFFTSLVIALPVSVFLSTLLNPGFISFYDSSRYLYYSSILTASFWGITLWQIIKTKKILLIPIVLVLGLWITYNKYKIDLMFTRFQDRHDAVLATFKFFRENKEPLNADSVIVIPKEVGHYGAGMINHFYGDENWNLLLDDESQDKYNFYLKYDTITKKVNKISGSQDAKQN